MIVADSDVLIDFLGGREPDAGRVTREIESGNLWTTVITRFELLSGARGSREVRIVSELLDSIKIAPLVRLSRKRSPYSRIVLTLLIRTT